MHVNSNLLIRIDTKTQTSPSKCLQWQTMGMSIVLEKNGISKKQPELNELRQNVLLEYLSLDILLYF